MKLLFRERNQAVIGLVFVVGLALVVTAAFNVSAITTRFGRSYHAVIAEAGGLKASDAVTINGLKIGRVTDVSLAKKGVQVTFSVTNGRVQLGSRTSAAVKVATVLGDKELALTSAGAGHLAEHATIPLTRTRAPFDVQSALEDLTTEAGQLDTRRVAAALDTLSTTLAGTPEELSSALTGVRRMAHSLNTRDAQLLQLASHAADFSGVLADRSGQLRRLVVDGNLLFAELERRQQAISALLSSVEPFADQLHGLVRDNRDQFGPALDSLNKVIRLLRQNRGNLQLTLRRIAAYSTSLGEAVGSGRLFTAKVQNILPGNLVPAVPGADTDLFGSLLAPLLRGGQ